VALLATVPVSLVVLVRPWLGILLLFGVSLIIIEIKRLAWTLEVGLMIEFLEGILAISMALAVVTWRDPWRFASPLTAAAGLYALYQVVLSLHPGLPTMANVIYALRDVINFSVPFFAALYFIRDRRHVRWILYAWLGTALLIALYGLKQEFLGLNSWEHAWLDISLTHVIYGKVRVFSTLGSADDLGMHMAISIVLALAVTFHLQDRRVRLICLAMVPLFIAVILYTLTRGAYLAVFVGVLALALITRSRALLVSLPIAAGLIIGWYQLSQDSLVANRLATVFSPEQDASFTIRQGYLQDYMPLVLANPFGLGPATSGRQGGVLLAAGGVDPALIDSLAGVPTDNYYFRIALENGWTGLVFFIGLLGTVGWVGLRIYLAARDPLLRCVAAAILASYAAMAVASVSNNYFAAVDLKLFFWFSMGILANLPFLERGSRTP
jgi:hypothetical protein